MSVTTSPPAFTDPLAEEAAVSFCSREHPREPEPSRDAEPAHQGHVSRERAALLAPDVEGLTGTDAIELVRSSGLIAAIETVELTDDSQQGLVLEQDPAPGTQMLRDGVLTLQVAQTPAEPQGAHDDAVAAQSHAESSPAASDEYEDDTEQWFATLGPTLDLPAFQADQRAPRRRRKHRPTPIPGADTSTRFEVPPDPLPPASSSPTEEHPSLSPQPDAYDPLPEEHWEPSLSLPADCPPLEDHWDPSLQPTASHHVPDGYGHPSPELAAPGHLTSLIAAVLVRLPDRSVTPTWRRRALIFAAAAIGLLLFTRAAASHSHHAVSASLAPVPAPPLRPTTTITAVRHHRSTPITPHDRPAARLPAVPPRHVEARRTPHEWIAATASAADPVPTTTASSSSPSEPTPGPFIYLGK